MNDDEEHRRPRTKRTRRKTKPRDVRDSLPKNSRGTMRMMEGVLRIHELLRPGNVLTKQQLQDELEASDSTVDRYLKFLRERLCADIEYDRETNGYRYTGKQIPLPAPMLTEGDLIALYVAAPILAQYRGTQLGEQFEASFEKIVALLPERTRQRMYVVPGRVEVKARVPVKEDPARFNIILNALHRCRQLDLHYSPAYRKAMTHRIVEPYVLCVVESKWYLLGHDHLRKRITTFAIDRIWSVKELAQEFQRPVGFSAREYLKDSLGIFKPPQESGEEATEIVIKFDSLAERYVKDTRVHPSQRIKDLPGGGIELRVTLCCTPDVENFVLRWGEHAEVIAPSSLRERVQERVRKMHAIYGAPHR